jgi:hypothetical protein
MKLLIEWMRDTCKSHAQSVVSLWLCATMKDTQVKTHKLQTSCYKSVHKLSTSCVRTACHLVVVTSLEQAVNNL